MLLLVLALDNPFPEGWKHLLLTFIFGDQSAFGLVIFVGLEPIVVLGGDDPSFLNIFFPVPSQVFTHCFVLFTDEYVPGGWWFLSVLYLGGRPCFYLCAGLFFLWHYLMN